MDPWLISGVISHNVNCNEAFTILEKIAEKVLTISTIRDILYRQGGIGAMGTNNQAKPQRSGENVNFERIRRITGYLVGTTDRWNDAKKAELDDRVKHTAKN